MYEYLTDAVVLERQPVGDKDSRVSFFTKRYGKLVGRAKSARRITSKLSGHIEPGMVLKLRAVERRGIQIVDALKEGKVQVDIANLRFLNQLLGDGEPDRRIWNALTSRTFSWSTLLGHLGWDTLYARCTSCGQNPESFHIRSQEFFCTWCASRLAQEEVLYM